MYNNVKRQVRLFAWSLAVYSSIGIFLLDSVELRHGVAKTVGVSEENSRDFLVSSSLAIRSLGFLVLVVSSLAIRSLAFLVLVVSRWRFAAWDF